MRAIYYQTEKIKDYHSVNRIRWDQFYESERKVIQRIWPDSEPRVLDIGCGCGGLGLALREQFGAARYLGIEINRQAVRQARILYPAAVILEGDFLSAEHPELTAESFDLVFSLSCIDWQLNFRSSLKKAWSLVVPGGRLIASLRLTHEAGIDDMERSYQYIDYEGKMEGEIAPYVVLNAGEWMNLMNQLGGLSDIHGYGYPGRPSRTAVTPYAELCFAVFALRKRSSGNPGSASVQLELDLPEGIQGQLTEIANGWRGRA